MTKPDPIHVLLIDNHPLVTDGLKAILDTYSGIAVVGSAASVEAGLELARQLKPQVILLDINMPKVSGIDAIPMFLSESPGCRVVMLSMHDSREYVSSSIMRGASGYVLKDVATDEIVAAIETTAAGRTYFSSNVSDLILGRTPDDGADPLTTREQDVLRGIALGRSNRDMAGELGISVATVETHRKNLKRKLGLPATADLIRYAVDKLVRP